MAIEELNFKFYLILINLRMSSHIWLVQWFLTGGDFAPKGHLEVSGVTFGCQN